MGNVADKVKIAQDKDGMLRRALERIIQLYTDKSHFVYELLQNAEDAEATVIKFIQYDDRLEVIHDGRPFTASNLQGLCDIGKSDKVDNLNQIGEFGVGFKSVFGICDTVRLYSKPENYTGKSSVDMEAFAVEILDFTRPEDISDEPMPSGYTTRFVFPYAVGQSFSGFSSIKGLKETLSKKLQNLGITTLLFMKNLSLIEYQIKTDTITAEGQYLLDKNKLNNHCSLVSALGTSGKDNDEECINYLMFTRRIGEGSMRTVDIAFPVAIAKDGTYECLQPKHPYISVYFPTETESKVNFIIQGPFRTTPNRSSIPADDPDNIELANQTAILLRDSLHELRDVGILNMSFIKVLPVDQYSFYNYALFEPLYNTVKDLLSTEEMLPCKAGGYVSARYARISRAERLSIVVDDTKLTTLIHDGHSYHWLPSYLTETNREYEQVYRFLLNELQISVIRPEDLRNYFNSNPAFLPAQEDDWLVALYQMLENNAAAFSRNRAESNMLTCEIIRTENGQFVAPFRKSDAGKLIPNVFLPSPKIRSKEINFVDKRIYTKCRRFFDDVLQLHEPDEYEFFIQDIKRRYKHNYVFDEEQHIADIKFLLKYQKYEDYSGAIQEIIHDYLVLRCQDGIMHRPSMKRIYVPENDAGVKIAMYFRNVLTDVIFVDTDFYALHEITVRDLCSFGVHDSIYTGDTITSGTYFYGTRGRQPEWWTTGDFRWKLSLDSVKEVLKYIGQHPTAKDSILKSKTIMDIVLKNEDKCHGMVFISGSTPNLTDESCELIKILRGEQRIQGWNGKWLYTESLELVAQRSISRFDLSESIYGKCKSDSSIYDLLGFKKTEADEVGALKKSIPKKQLDALFESELRLRYGISSSDLAFRLDSVGETSRALAEDVTYQFPISQVKSWDALRKHAAEMLTYANPVKYEYVVRSVRVSNKPKESRAYLTNMYRYDGTYKYACQLCHESCSSVEATQIFANPEVELDPMNICLCPNCASKYRTMRTNKAEMDRVKNYILGVRENEVLDSEQVTVRVAGEELWFTQTHFAEVQELLRLEQDIKKKENDTSVVPSADDTDTKPGLSIYDQFVGKRIRRPRDGFIGKVKKVDSQYLHVVIEKDNSRKPGQEVKIDLKKFIEFRAKNVYEIIG